MRTTLTLDDDLARRLKELARGTDRNFKEVVNDAIRKGLSIGDGAPDGQEPFVVRPQACGFRNGIDPTKLNQIYDDLEMGELLGDTGLSVDEK